MPSSMESLVYCWNYWLDKFKTFGIWFLAVSCELFGRKEIGALLRISTNPWLNYKIYARRLYLIGLGVRASWIVPLSWSSFLLLVLHFKFFLVVCCCLFVYCISLCSSSWTPCICFLLFYSLFNNTLITYQKKECEVTLRINKTSLLIKKKKNFFHLTSCFSTFQ